MTCGWASIFAMKSFPSSMKVEIPWCKNCVILKNEGLSMYIVRDSLQCAASGAAEYLQ